MERLGPTERNLSVIFSISRTSSSAKIGLRIPAHTNDSLVEKFLMLEMEAIYPAEKANFIPIARKICDFGRILTQN